jgi:hypothetical protein
MEALIFIVFFAFITLTSGYLFSFIVIPCAENPNNLGGDKAQTESTQVEDAETHHQGGPIDEMEKEEEQPLPTQKQKTDKLKRRKKKSKKIKPKEDEKEQEKDEREKLMKEFHLIPVQEKEIPVERMPEIEGFLLEQVLQPKSEAERLQSLFKASTEMRPAKEVIETSKSLIESIPKDPEDDKFIIHVLDAALQNQGVQLVVSETTGTSETLGLHLLLSGQISQQAWQVSFEETPSFTFDRLSSPSNLNKFVDDFKFSLAKSLNITPAEVLVFKVERGSISVTYQIINSQNMVIRDIDTSQMTEAIRKSSIAQGHRFQLKLHPVVEFCRLSLSQLDPRGNYDFRNSAEVQQRGGFKYFQPLGWKRYGLNVLGKYSDPGFPQDQWLAMNGMNYYFPTSSY